LGSTPGAATCPTVPAVDIATTTNAFNANAFTMLGVNAHHGTAPFFSFLNNGIPTAAFYSHNVIDVGTVEAVRSGFVRAYGALALGLEVRAAFYDSKTIDGHVIETGTGGGGRNSEQCRIGPLDFVSVITAATVWWASPLTRPGRSRVSPRRERRLRLCQPRMASKAGSASSCPERTR
jgi:hypothetical protein